MSAARPLTGDLTFGLGMISAQHDPRDTRSDADIYADILDVSARAETLGLDAVWLSEHHFVDDGYAPSLLTMAAAIAARTSSIAIATGVLLAPLYDPIRLAEDAATVDLIANGRLVLGLGAGYRDEEFAGFGKAKEGLGAVLDHTLGVLRGSWAGRPVRSAGSEIVVTPRPATPVGPPIWLGARSKPGVRRTARAADGLLAARVSPDELATQVEELDRALLEVGRRTDEVAVGVHCPVFAWPDAAEAWQRVEPHLHYSEWKYADMVREAYGPRRRPPGLPPELDSTARARLRPGALVGAPEDVAAGIAAYANVVGDHPFHFVARLYWPGMDPMVLRDALAIFASDVVPAVRAARQRAI